MSQARPRRGGLTAPALTAMSGSHPAPPPTLARNQPIRLIFASLVRFVHAVGTVVQCRTLPSRSHRAGARADRPRRRALPGLALSLAVPTLAAVGGAACVVPPDLSIEGDDTPAENSPPILVSVADRSGNPFTRPGPHTLTIGDDRLTVTVADNDRADVLTLYFFVDYGLPLPTSRRVECLAAPGTDGERERTVVCDVNTICLPTEASTNHVLEIEVFDRNPVDTGNPPFRSVAPPGLSTSWWWDITCAVAV